MKGYELFKDIRGEWRFNLRASNGKVIATSEGYKSERNARNGIDSVRHNASTYDVAIRKVK